MKHACALLLLSTLLPSAAVLPAQTRSEFKSIAFLVPLANREGDDREFHRNFAWLGYDAVIVSDYHGLRGQPDSAVFKWLQRTLGKARKFEAATSIRPRLILDVAGFRLNTNPRLRRLAYESDYVAAYHVADEPDSHANGTPDRPDTTPEEIDALLTGSGELGKYRKPLFITFENQAGVPSSRKWNYRNNDDALYLAYMAVLKKHHAGRNYIGIDYYLFNRSLKPPRDQRMIFDMMAYFTELVRRHDPQAYAFAWTEPVYQGLGYICSNREWRGRPANAPELWAQIWLYWVAGQRGVRGDFNYIFDHLCKGKKTWNPDGLAHPYYGKNGQRFVVQFANQLQRKLGKFLDAPNQRLTTSNDVLVASARTYREGGRLRALVIAVNLSDRRLGRQTIEVPASLAGRALDVLGEERSTVIDDRGALTDSFRPYETHFYIMELESPGPGR